MQESVEAVSPGIEGVVGQPEGFAGRVRDNLSAFLHGAGFVAAAPYRIPTSVRLYPEMIDRANGEGGDSVVTGWVYGVALNSLQAVGYLHACLNGYPEVLAALPATNALSTAYEMGRRSSSRKRLLEE